MRDSINLWIQGARPKTLPAAIAPVVVGAACAQLESSTQNNWLKLSDVGITPLYESESEYVVRVATETNETKGNYGNPCVILISAKIKSSDKSEIKTTAYPNPYLDSFYISYPTDKKEIVTVSIFDMSGRQVAQSKHEVAELNEQQFGQGLSAGVYNIILEQGTEIKTLRVVKQ